MSNTPRFSNDPEITIQVAIKKLLEEEWVHHGDHLITVTNVFAHDKVVESIQIREVTN